MCSEGGGGLALGPRLAAGEGVGFADSDSNYSVLGTRYLQRFKGGPMSSRGCDTFLVEIKQWRAVSWCELQAGPVSLIRPRGEELGRLVGECGGGRGWEQWEQWEAVGAGGVACESGAETPRGL